MKRAAVAGVSTLVAPAAVAELQAAAGQQTFIASGDTWRYLDNGSDQGTAWRQTSFNDSAWASGVAVIGYGYQGDLVTFVGYGPDPNNKYFTTYFRRAFFVTDPTAFNTLIFSLRRDDGAVVYLNGTEIWRSNMPTGAIDFKTHAATSASDDGSTWFQTTVSSSGLLVAGTNVVAVEVHQFAAYSSDVIFDLQLIGSGVGLPATVTRGPYLQTMTPTSAIVRWRTDVATDSYVRYGTSPGNLSQMIGDAAVTTEHEVLVYGLTPRTRYFYSVGTAARTLAGNDVDFSFVTSLLPGSTTGLRIWVLGCSGTGGNTERLSRVGYQRFTAGVGTDVWLMLGDNAYNSGTDAEFQAAVFQMFPGMLKKAALWPALGNHDTADSTNPPSTLPYFKMFTLPTSGEAGGFPSGTEKYYSYDYGNVHFVVLDAMTSNRLSTGPMLAWLRSDLAATTQPWLIAYWHHPVYSKGNHDSDADIESIEMRQNAVRILEDYGVDLVLNAHSHTYERSFLLDGHYGLSSTFQQSMKVDAGDGRVEGNGAYHKPTYGRGSHDGAVYTVAGTPAQIDTSGPLNHPAIYTTLTVPGSMVLDVADNRLDATFVSSTGAVQDHFTIIKGGGGTALAAPTGLTATAISTTQITLNWTDNSSDELGFKIEQSADGITFAQIATVGPNVTTYPNTGLTSGTTYYYRVRAYKAGVDSAASNTANATTLASAPAAPSLLTATAASATQITLAWTDNSSNEQGFKIEQSPDGITFTQIATVGPNVTTYPNSGLTPATKYYYRVKAYNAVGDSTVSNTASATTSASTAPSLTVSAASVVTGAPVTATLTGGLGGSTDWIGLAAVGSPDTTYLQWVYVGTGVTSRTWTVNMPTTPGTYEFRLFLNNGYTRVATSPAVTVQPPAPVIVPSVVGATQAAATTTLTNAGLVLGTVTTASSTSVNAGLVISQNPAGGVQVASGSAVALVVSSGPPPPFAAVRIHAGGPAYTDSAGQIWAADKNFTGGTSYSDAVPIAGTVDPALYQTVRYGDFSYNIPVPAGTYTVVLYFAEIYWTQANQRLFDVTLEGTVVLSNFDILASAGGANTALVKTFTVNVTDGTLNIGFVSRLDNAMVSAIQVSA